ncbi:hypothetical protein ACFTSD_25055 [Nocardiaceae bacterium NPDC056970]
MRLDIGMGIGALALALALTACGGSDDTEQPSTPSYEDMITELACFNPGTTYDEMDAAMREAARELDTPLETVTHSSVLQSREYISIDGKYGKPCT